MYDSPTSSMARVVSQTMNATQAMKMNITFCSSPMPKSENVKRNERGDRDVAAEQGHRQEKRLHPGKTAAEHAQRHADQRGQAEPEPSRRSVVSRLRVRARSNQRL